jgi:Holliday junction DNA helicase RuvA
MIAYLRGKLVHKEPTHVIVDVGGIGYEATISLNTFTEIKDREDVRLATYLHVREDAQLLFGFSTEAEKAMFLNLISINGVGPNTAMVMLSSLPPAELRAAILREDAATLQAVKGIGAKTAQRIILELRDKLRKGGVDSGPILGGAAGNTLRQEALTALTTLGVSRAAAEQSVDAVLRKTGNTLSLEDLVKQALKNT